MLREITVNMSGRKGGVHASLSTRTQALSPFETPNKGEKEGRTGGGAVSPPLSGMYARYKSHAAYIM